VLIEELIWPQDRIDHIARHRVQPDEVEEVCFGTAWVRRAKAAGKKPSLLRPRTNQLRTILVLCRYSVSEWKGFPGYATADDGERKATI
jgi:hypothetical protein